MGEDDGWGGANFLTQNSNYALQAGKKYTIRMISPNGYPISYIRTSNNSAIQFPVNLGFMQIVDAKTSLNNQYQAVKSGFPAIILGFTSQ